MNEATAKSSELFLEELVSSTNRLLAKVDERSRTVLALRILAIGDTPTLQELGSRFSLTRERIRQIEVKVEKKVRFRIGQRENKAFYEVSSRMREQLGQVIATERLENLRRAFNASKLTRECPMLLPLLLWEAGPYRRHENFIVRAPTEKIVANTNKILHALTQHGPTDILLVRRELSRMGVKEDVQERWISHLESYRVLGGRVVRWHGNLADKAEAVLVLREHPMTQEELSAEIAEEHNGRTLANRLVGDVRFCRTDPDHFALRAWGLEEYSSIADKLAEEIELKGGEATPEHLISTLIAKFGVSATSVRSYLSSPRFTRTGRGTFRIRTDQESFTIGKRVELTRRCYQLPQGWAYRVTIDDEVTRGSGRAVPAAFAVELGLAPLKSIELASRWGKVQLGWRSQQPTIGSLRRVVEDLGGKIGDYLFIEFVSNAGLEFRVVKRVTVEQAAGLERLQIEMGCLPEADEQVAVKGMAFALGLENGDSSIAAIRRRLEARAENDLVRLLPDEAGSDHTLALQELLELVGG